MSRAPSAASGCAQRLLDEPWRLTPTASDAASYCHAEVVLPSASAAIASNMTLALRKGRTIEGEVFSADGRPISQAVLLCSGRVSPMRNGLGQPLMVKDGRFALPGCVEGNVYTVLVLDTKNAAGSRRQGVVPGPTGSSSAHQASAVRRGAAARPADGLGKIARELSLPLPVLVLAPSPNPYPVGQPPKGARSQSMWSRISGIDLVLHAMKIAGSGRTGR